MREGEAPLACPTEACEGGWWPLPRPLAPMPSASANRKTQEKPREVMDAAEVGLPLPRAGRTDPWAGARGGRAEGERDPALGVPVGASPAGWGPGAQGPRRDSGALAKKRGQTLSGPDRTGPLSHRPGFPAAGRGEGGREAPPAPEVAARGHPGVSLVRHVPHVNHHLGH